MDLKAKAASLPRRILTVILFSLRMIDFSFKTAAAACLLSCGGFADFNPPELESLSPGDGALCPHKRPAVYALFTEPMNRALTESAFSLSSQSHKPQGFFRWEGQALHFELLEDLRPGQDYELSVSGTAEDIEGNNIPSGAVSRFTAGTGSARPELIKLFYTDSSGSEKPLPDSEKGIGFPVMLRARFTEKLDLKSVFAGFKLSPPLDGSINLSPDGCSLIYTPYGSFTNGLLYTLTFSDEISGVSGSRISESLEYTFRAGEDYEFCALEGAFVLLQGGAEPLYEGILNSGTAEKESGFEIRFSRAMNRERAENAVSIHPAVQYRTYWLSDNSMAISLRGSSSFIPGEIYYLSAGKSAEDTNGCSLDRDYLFRFIINGPGSLPLHVHSVLQMKCLENGPDSGSGGWDISAPFSVIRLHPEPGACYFDRNSRAVYVLRVIFENSGSTLSERGIDIFSAFDAVKFTYETYTGSGPLTGLRVPVIAFMEISPSDPRAVDIHLSNIEAETYYRLEIRGGTDGIKDKPLGESSANSMRKTFISITGA